MKNRELAQYDYRGELTELLIDDFSERTGEVLQKLDTSKRDIIRFRLSLETAMAAWLKEQRGSSCLFSVRRKFGRVSVLVTMEGNECNPLRINKSELGDFTESTLLQNLGLTIGYSYKNGVNRISITPASVSGYGLTYIIAALILGIASGLLLKNFCPVESAALYDNIVSPVFETLMNLLKTIAGPLVFLAVLSGIYGIGDMTALGQAGKKLLLRFIYMTFGILGIGLICLLAIIPVSVEDYASGSDTFGALLSMVLEIIPTDIVSPFQNGNTLQILFLAAAFGIGMLIMGDKASGLGRIVDQTYGVLELLMEAIGRIMPLFIFSSCLAVILSGSDLSLNEFLIPFGATIAVFLIVTLFYTLYICRKLQVRFLSLIRNMIPTYLVALSTASSVAAFSANMDTCEKKFGIDKNITCFGIPLGQVIFMPFGAVEYLAITMTLAAAFSVSVTPMWAFMAFLMCGILAIATPPIPGGSMSLFAIMFAQLNIPNEALALAISLDLILDHFVTAADLISLQELLILTADRLGYLDRETLKKNN